VRQTEIAISVRQKNLALEVLGRPKQSKVVCLYKKKVSVGHIGRDAFLRPMFLGVVAVRSAACPKTVNRQRAGHSQAKNASRKEASNFSSTLWPEDKENKEQRRDQRHETVFHPHCYS